MDDALDVVLFGPETLEQAKFEQLVKRRRSKKKNHAK